jgi:hypothetical protein
MRLCGIIIVLGHQTNMMLLIIVYFQDVPDFGFRSYFVPSFPVYPLDAAQEWYDYKTSYEQTQYGRKLILLPHLVR